MFHLWSRPVQAGMRAFTVAAAIVCLVLPSVLHAQTVAGQISGRVTDSSGGVLPGVTVTLTNANTGLVVERITDENGQYVATNLPVGPYSVEANLTGFRKIQRTGFQLTADGRISADFSLSVGAMSETVEVQAVLGETVNRTSGEVSRTIDSAQIKDLAFNGRNYMELASLIPGAVATDFDPLNLATSLSITGQSINGSRGNTNNLTIDGGQNLDSGSNGSQVNNVGLSFIDQVKIQTSNFSAELGRNSGASINVVTKSGTNRLGGTARFDSRDEALDRPNYFAARDAGGKRTKPSLEFRNVEAAIGGPIIRNKLFFFGGQQYRTINRFTNPSRQTLPTSAELAGDFSLRLRGVDGVVGSADDGVLMDPATGAGFAGNRIPAGRITADGRAVANTYAKMISLAAEYSDTPTSNNATFQLANPYKFRQDVVRLDWQATGNQRIYGRYLHDNYDLLDPYGVFSGAQLPTVPTNRLRPGYSYQVSHTYVASKNLINEAKVSAAWNGQRINPQGDTWRRDSYGYQFQELFPGGFITEGIPQVGVSGFAGITSPSFALLSPTTDITFQDSITYLRGSHSIRSGVAVSRNRKDQNGRASYLGNVSYNPGGNPNTTGQGLGDALLGNFRSYNEASADPVGFFRFTAYQGFVSDTWRLLPNLSLEAGVRYEYQQPTYTQGNNIVNFDPDLYDASQAVTVQRNGLLAPGSGNRYNGLIRAGDGVPKDQEGRVQLQTGGDYDRIPTGAPRGLYDAQHLVMPRLSFAYSVTPATVVRGGGGLFYDKPEGNLVFSQLNLPPILDTVTFENANIANPTGGSAAARGAIGDINAINPDLQLPQQLNFSLGVQRELGNGYFVEASYVGNRGKHLIRQPDINQPSFEDQTANQRLPSAQRASTNFLRPYRGYSAIRMRLSDSESTYNSLQLYATKRKGALTFTVSYTLGKALTDASGNGDNPEDPFNRAYSYGPASFDRRHAFVSTFTYRLPFLLDRGDLLETALGGWEVSGKTRYQTGQYLTVQGNTLGIGRRADYVGGDVEGPRTEAQWFNTAAFVNPPEDRRGNAEVGQVQGPEFYQWDLSFRKNFRFGGRYSVSPQFDIFNLFNRVNFNNPNTSVTSGAYGTIGSANPSRQAQIGIRLDF